MKVLNMLKVLKLLKKSKIYLLRLFLFLLSPALVFSQSCFEIHTEVMCELRQKVEESLNRIAKPGSLLNQKTANHCLKQYRGKP